MRIARLAQNIELLVSYLLESFDQIRMGQSFIVPADLNICRLKEETTVRISHLLGNAACLHPKDSLAIMVKL